MAVLQRFRTIKASILRPADVTAYEAGDIVGAPITFSVSAATNARLLSARVQCQSPVAGDYALAIDCFSTRPTVPADNAAMVATGADWIAHADLFGSRMGGAFVAGGRFPIDTGTSLYAPEGIFFGVLTTLRPFVPVSADRLLVTLELELSA